MGFFKIFTANTLTHFRIVFPPRTHKTRFLPLILRYVHSFTLAFDLWVTWQQQLCCNSSLLHCVDAVIS